MMVYWLRARRAHEAIRAVRRVPGIGIDMLPNGTTLASQAGGPAWDQRV
jgi:hypothetical protein